MLEFPLGSSLTLGRGIVQFNFEDAKRRPFARLWPVTESQITDLQEVIEMANAGHQGRLTAAKNGIGPGQGG